MKKYLLALVVILISTSNLFSIDFKFGLSGGYDVSGHTFEPHSYREQSGELFPVTFENMNPDGFFLGFKTDMIFNFGVFNSIMLDFSYSSLSDESLKQGEGYTYLMHGQNGSTTVFVATSIVKSLSTESMTLSVLPKFDFFDIGLKFFTGPTFEYYLTAQTKEAEYFFDKQEIYYDGDIPDFNDLRIGWATGLMYEFNVDRYTIAPFLSFDLPLTVQQTELQWKIAHIKLGFDILYSL